MSDHHDEVDLRAAHPGDALSALLDGELEPADEAAVRRHLAACEPCRIEFDDVTIVRRTVRGLPAVAADPTTDAKCHTPFVGLVHGGVGGFLASVVCRVPA